jgi:hypothetical protein
MSSGNILGSQDVTESIHNLCVGLPREEWRVDDVFATVCRKNMKLTINSQTALGDDYFFISWASHH